MSQSASYSVDCLKYTIFLHELQNELELVDSTYRDEEWLAVHDYFIKRMKELRKHGTQG